MGRWTRTRTIVGSDGHSCYHFVEKLAVLQQSDFTVKFQASSIGTVLASLMVVVGRARSEGAAKQISSSHSHFGRHNSAQSVAIHEYHDRVRNLLLTSAHGMANIVKE